MLKYDEMSFNGHPPLGVNATGNEIPHSGRRDGFNGHPPLGVNATYFLYADWDRYSYRTCFNKHPPLGVNATTARMSTKRSSSPVSFQQAPTLGGECYEFDGDCPVRAVAIRRFNKHPPLGVNAT